MNELQTLVDDGNERMTSLQIAEVTGKAHKDVMRAIRNMEPAWEKICGRKFALSSREVKQPNGGTRETSCYSLDKEECLYIATKFNDEARAKLIKRWKELEEKHHFQIPHSYSEALMLAANQAKQIEQQQAQIATISKANTELGKKVTEMLPKANYYDVIMESNATMTVTQIAQDYGMSAIMLNRKLEELKIQRKVQGQWILYRDYISGGYVHSRAIDITRSDGRKDVKYNTEWTVKGRVFLYNILKEHGILPDIEKGIKQRQEAKRESIQQTINFN